MSETTRMADMNPEINSDVRVAAAPKRKKEGAPAPKAKDEVPRKTPEQIKSEYEERHQPKEFNLNSHLESLRGKVEAKSKRRKADQAKVFRRSMVPFSVDSDLNKELASIDEELERKTPKGENPKHDAVTVANLARNTAKRKYSNAVRSLIDKGMSDALSSGKITQEDYDEWSKNPLYDMMSQQQYDIAWGDEDLDQRDLDDYDRLTKSLEKAKAFRDEKMGGMSHEDYRNQYQIAKGKAETSNPLILGYEDVLNEYERNGFLDDQDEYDSLMIKFHNDHSDSERERVSEVMPGDFEYRELIESERNGRTRQPAKRTDFRELGKRYGESLIRDNAGIDDIYRLFRDLRDGNSVEYDGVTMTGEDLGAFAQAAAAVAQKRYGIGKENPSGAFTGQGYDQELYYAGDTSNDEAAEAYEEQQQEREDYINAKARAIASSDRTENDIATDLADARREMEYFMSAGYLVMDGGKWVIQDPTPSRTVYDDASLRRMSGNVKRAMSAKDRYDTLQAAKDMREASVFSDSISQIRGESLIDKYNRNLTHLQAMEANGKDKSAPETYNRVLRVTNQIRDRIAEEMKGFSADDELARSIDASSGNGDYSRIGGKIRGMYGKKLDEDEWFNNLTQAQKNAIVKLLDSGYVPGEEPNKAQSRIISSHTGAAPGSLSGLSSDEVEKLYVLTTVGLDRADGMNPSDEEVRKAGEYASELIGKYGKDTVQSMVRDLGTAVGDNDILRSFYGGDFGDGGEIDLGNGAKITSDDLQKMMKAILGKGKQGGWAHNPDTYQALRRYLRKAGFSKRDVPDGTGWQRDFIRRMSNSPYFSKGDPTKAFNDESWASSDELKRYANLWRKSKSGMFSDDDLSEIGLNEEDRDAYALDRDAILKEMENEYKESDAELSEAANIGSVRTQALKDNSIMNSVKILRKMRGDGIKPWDNVIPANAEEAEDGMHLDFDGVVGLYSMIAPAIYRASQRDDGSLNRRDLSALNEIGNDLTPQDINNMERIMLSLADGTHPVSEGGPVAGGLNGMAIGPGGELLQDNGENGSGGITTNDVKKAMNGFRNFIVRHNVFGDEVTEDFRTNRTHRFGQRFKNWDEIARAYDPDYMSYMGDKLEFDENEAKRRGMPVTDDEELIDILANGSYQPNTGKLAQRYARGLPEGSEISNEMMEAISKYDSNEKLGEFGKGLDWDQMTGYGDEGKQIDGKMDYILRARDIVLSQMGKKPGDQLTPAEKEEFDYRMGKAAYDAWNVAYKENGYDVFDPMNEKKVYVNKVPVSEKAQSNIKGLGKSMRSKLRDAVATMENESANPLLREFAKGQVREVASSLIDALRFAVKPEDLRDTKGLGDGNELKYRLGATTGQIGFNEPRFQTLASTAYDMLLKEMSDRLESGEGEDDMKKIIGSYEFKNDFNVLGYLGRITGRDDHAKMAEMHGIGSDGSEDAPRRPRTEGSLSFREDTPNTDKHYYHILRSIYDEADRRKEREEFMQNAEKAKAEADSESAEYEANDPSGYGNMEKRTLSGLASDENLPERDKKLVTKTMRERDRQKTADEFNASEKGYYDMSDDELKKALSNKSVSEGDKRVISGILEERRRSNDRKNAKGSEALRASNYRQMTLEGLLSEYRKLPKDSSDRHLVINAMYPKVKELINGKSAEEIKALLNKFRSTPVQNILNHEAKEKENSEKTAMEYEKKRKERADKKGKEESK